MDTEYAAMQAGLAMDRGYASNAVGGSIVGAASKQSVLNSKPRLAALADNMSGLNERAAVMLQNICAAADRIIGTRPENPEAAGRDRLAADSAIGSLEASTETLAATLGRIHDQISRFNGL
ncbi:hypothetical protein FPZ24_08260 [Sphingomonas panacisoli]|uniref:Uncharacterized protein n=1 Tax=Sphingomonas panacisoli TaxID=1813879 RepID=A0A5B8LHX2_9SPHN|nr:hypothetical protein [Sphingomonas panacisoli]QDZ07476.1 hypothetical protein FPZ24_08260 [Sphingomonas panacisoli]